MAERPRRCRTFRLNAYAFVVVSRASGKEHGGSMQGTWYPSVWLGKKLHPSVWYKQELFARLPRIMTEALSVMRRTLQGSIATLRADAPEPLAVRARNAQTIVEEQRLAE